MTTKPFDPNKPVVCRDGCKAEIVARDLQNGMLGYVRTTTTGNRRLLTSRSDTGCCAGFEYECAHDLVNQPERVSRWSRVMGPTSWAYAARAEAERYAGQTVEFIFEDDTLVEVKIHE